MSETPSYNLCIPCKSLPTGDHNFDFALDGGFFAEYENQDINSASLNVHFLVRKTRPASLEVFVTIVGEVIVACDRCLADLSLPVNYEARLEVLFTKSAEEDEERGEAELICLSATETEADLSQYVYDSVCLSLPLQRVHPDGQCDPEMMRIWKENAGGSNPENGAFEALEKLIEK